MAIDLSAEYPGQVLTTDPTGYPYGRPKNQVTPGDGTGFPLEAKWTSDVHGFLQAILSAAAVTPSGTPDKVGASQYLNALQTLIRREAPLLNWTRVRGTHSTDGFQNGSGAFVPRDAAYHPSADIWLAVGTGDGCCASYDGGRTFIRRDSGMGSAVTLSGVAMAKSSANLSAIAVGSSTIYRDADIADDGSGWSGVTPDGSPSSLLCAVFDANADRYIIGGTTGSGPYVSQSDDNTGSAWSEYSAFFPASFAGLVVGSLASNDAGVVIAAASSTHNKIAVSTDGGATWADSTTTLASGVYSISYNALGGYFVACRVDGATNNTYTSTDGDTWTSVFSGSYGFDRFAVLDYRSAATLGGAIVVAGRLTNSTTDGAIAFSTNGGVSWSTTRVAGVRMQFMRDDGQGRQILAPYSAATNGEAGAATPRIAS